MSVVKSSYDDMYPEGEQKNTGPACIDHQCQAPACIIHSNHPLAVRMIRNLISSDPCLCLKTTPHSNLKLPTTGNCEILVLDTCSVGHWQESLQEWQATGRRIVALISPELPEYAEVEMLCSGITGIIAFSDELQQLPQVIHAVEQGKLWVRREVLSEYVRRTNRVLKHLASCDARLTSRERQIMEFLRMRYSNRQIASILDISERTVKFHVSNALKKCNVENRWDLAEMRSKILLSSNDYQWKDRLG